MLHACTIDIISWLLILKSACALALKIDHVDSRIHQTTYFIIRHCMDRSMPHALRHSLNCSTSCRWRSSPGPPYSVARESQTAMQRMTVLERHNRKTIISQVHPWILFCMACTWSNTSLCIGPLDHSIAPWTSTIQHCTGTSLDQPIALHIPRPQSPQCQTSFGCPGFHFCLCW